VDGLSAGIQIVGPYLENRTTLKFAHLVERDQVASSRRHLYKQGEYRSMAERVTWLGNGIHQGFMVWPLPV
jgi:hypothetical protein